MNRFPLIVEAEQPERRELFRNARVMCDGTTTRVYVWDQQARTGVVALTVAGVPKRAGYGVWRVRTEDGESYLFRDDGSCGCSHPLKAWRPAAPTKVGGGG